MADGSNLSTFRPQCKTTLVLVRDGEQDESADLSDAAEAGQAIGSVLLSMQNLNGTGARFVAAMVATFLASAPPWFFRN